jgi:hypothetical protein
MTALRRLQLASIPLLAILLLGCGKSSNLATVKGKVLLDGQPLTNGSIMTIPVAGKGAKATIQSDGSFELHTNADSDGASLGVHKISVVAYDGIRTGPESPPPKLIVPDRYTSPESSGLTIDVKASEENHPVLELSSK